MRAPANISVQIGSSITLPADAAEHIRAAVQQWLDSMNLPVAADVEIKAVDSPPGPRFLDAAILVNGTRCPFSKRQVAQCYASVTSGGLDQAAALSEAQALLVGNTGLASKTGLVTEMLAALALEAAKCSAEEFVTPEVAYALLAQARETPAAIHSYGDSDRVVVTGLLRRLTAVHVRVPDAAELLERVSQAHTEDLSGGELAEALIDEWRPAAIEIQLPVAAVRKMLAQVPVAKTAYYPADLRETYANALGDMCDGIFYELGVWFSRISVVADPQLAANTCRFRLHERLTPVLRVIGEDEVLVNASPDQLSREGIKNRRAWANPANGSENTVLPRDAKARVDAAHATWDQYWHIILLLSAELRSSAWWLLSLEDVENLLDKMSTAFPALVNTALQEYSPLRIAQVLRWLLRRGVSVRDFRNILQLMLDFSYTTGIRSPTAGWSGREPYIFVGGTELTGEPYFTKDDPYVAEFDLQGIQLCAEPPSDWVATGRLIAEFVKCGLREYFTHKISRGQFNTIICYLLDEHLEKRLVTARMQGSDSHPFDPEETSGLLFAMQQEFVDKWGAAGLFLATTPDVAFLVEDLMEKDFPETVVLHRQVIESFGSVQPVATVLLEKRAQ
jgi:hypothetical protein